METPFYVLAIEGYKTPLQVFRVFKIKNSHIPQISLRLAGMDWMRGGQ